LILNDVIGLFEVTQSFELHHDPVVYLASNRNEYQECFWEGEVRPDHEADNLIATGI
jgi:hypothetical protein